MSVSTLSSIQGEYGSKSPLVHARSLARRLGTIGETRASSCRHLLSMHRGAIALPSSAAVRASTSLVAAACVIHARRPAPEAGQAFSGNLSGDLWVLARQRRVGGQDSVRGRAALPAARPTAEGARRRHAEIRFAPGRCALTRREHESCERPPPRRLVTSHNGQAHHVPSVAASRLLCMESHRLPLGRGRGGGRPRPTPAAALLVGTVGTPLPPRARGAAGRDNILHRPRLCGSAAATSVSTGARPRTGPLWLMAAFQRALRDRGAPPQAPSAAGLRDSTKYLTRRCLQHKLK